MVSLMCVAHRPILGQDLVDQPSVYRAHRHPDEDQRLIRHRRVKEAEIVPLLWGQTVAQIVPAVNRMHRLVGDDPVQNIGGRGPVDRAQHQKVAIEP